MKKIFWAGFTITVFANMVPNTIFAEDLLVKKNTVEALAVSPDAGNALQSAETVTRDPFQDEVEEKPVTAPTEPALAAAPPPPMIEVAIQLQGVGLGSGEKDAFALINGEVFYEGEEKQNIKLVQVRKQEVDLLVNGISQTVKLIPEDDISRMQKAKEQRDKLRKAPKQAIAGKDLSIPKEGEKTL